MLNDLLQHLINNDLSTMNNELFASLNLPSFISVFWAVVIFLIGRWLARRSRAWFRTAVGKTDIVGNKKLIFAAERIIYYGIILLAITLSLAILGIPIDILVSILAILAILVAIALQTSLSNFAATIIFLVFQTFKPGDWIEVSNNIFGKVKEIQMFSTVMVTQEKSTVTIPNGVIMAGNIVNYSELGYRRVDMTVTIMYGDDLLKAKDIMEQVLANSEFVLDDPQPIVGVIDLGDKGVNFSLRPFTLVEHIWDARFALIEEIKLKLDDAGIKIPVTQHDIHLYQEQ